MKATRSTTSAPKPDFSVIDPKRSDYEQKRHDAYLYFDETYDYKVLKSETLRYAKTDYPGLKSLPDYKFMSVGKLCWLLNNKAKISQTSMDYLKERLEDLSIESEKYVQASDNEESRPPEKKVSVQDHMAEKLSGLIAELEGVLDREDYGFDSYSWMKAKEIAKIHAEKIVEYYSPLLAELDLAVVKKSDPQIQEAYHKISKKEIERFRDCVANIIKNAESYIGMKKVSRKPRKKKSIPASKVVKNLNYQKEDNTYKIASVDPTAIVGASELWTFNTKTRLLTRYITESPNGFTVKGTTLLNWSIEESESKRVRKPEITLKEVLEAGKVKLRKIIPDLTTKPVEVNGRINKDTILLRVTK